MQGLKNQNSNGTVVSFQKFQMKKIEEDHLARGRQPLYVSHARSIIQKDAQGRHRKNLSNFGDRIAQMRLNLKKIDAFVGDLSRLSSQSTRK